MIRYLESWEQRDWNGFNQSVKRFVYRNPKGTDSKVMRARRVMV